MPQELMKGWPSGSVEYLAIKGHVECTFEKAGLIWVWHGATIPYAPIPSLVPPSEFNIHAQIFMEFPIEHGLLPENLAELYYAPFTHTTTFAKHIN